ncbi:MAG: TonB-dependent receptor, partial [FCB group bacterium]|nr:TonB-dependent receptor [FCB group bacterium]
KFGDPTAKSERVYDWELGGNFRQKNFTAGVNLYWMEFRNEIIPYGGIDDNGVAITVNADRSVHAGVELTSSYKLYKYINFSGNFAYNYNRIKDYTGGIDVYLPDWSSYRLPVNYKDKKIAGFPDYLANLMVNYNDTHWQATMRLRMIGKQYMGLCNIDSLAIDPYTVASVSASYKLENFFKVGNVTFMLRINNLFDKKYRTSGYSWTYGTADGVNQPVSLIHEAEYFVAAERTFYGQLKMEFF